jgi:hypothetical protein
MKPTDIAWLWIALLMACGVAPVGAQQAPSGKPGADDFRREGKPDWKNGERPKGGKGMPPELRGGEFFLQAGDPRFERMLVLAFAPGERIEAELQKWPTYQDAEPENRERMRRQLEFFRNRIQGAALREAESAGLKLPPDQQKDFVRAYWEKRIEVEKRIRAEVEPRLKAEMSAAMAELKKEFAAPPPPLGAGK